MSTDRVMAPREVAVLAAIEQLGGMMGALLCPNLDEATAHMQAAETAIEQVGLEDAAARAWARRATVVLRALAVAASWIAADRAAAVSQPSAPARGDA